MHQLWGTLHRAAVHVPDRLVPEAHAEHRDPPFGERRNRVADDAGVFGAAGPGALAAVFLAAAFFVVFFAAAAAGADAAGADADADFGADPNPSSPWPDSAAERAVFFVTFFVGFRAGAFFTAFFVVFFAVGFFANAVTSGPGPVAGG